MNNSASAGESSSKRQENGDAPSGSEPSERPLKKARFAWQVKGKHHLKNETNDPSTSSAALTNDADEGTGPSSESKDCSSQPANFVGNTEQNLEILGDYLLKQDFNTLDSVITDTDKSLLTPSTQTSTQISTQTDTQINTQIINAQIGTSDTPRYPRCFCTYDINESNDIPTFTINSIDSHNVVIPMSVVVTENHSEDLCIARWQAKQMAKGFVDNTINSVLDSWTRPPLRPAVDNSQCLALDVAEFINNLPGDNSIENEGILMAISAHGLQNASNSSGNTSENEEQSTSNNKDEAYEEQSTSNNKDEAFISPPSSPVNSDEEILNVESNNNIQDANGTPVSDLSSSNAEDTLTRENITHISFYPGSSHYQFFNENANIHNRGVEFDGDESSFDFIDVAVSFAIQNNGLTTSGTDYG